MQFFPSLSGPFQIVEPLTRSTSLTLVTILAFVLNVLPSSAAEKKLAAGARPNVVILYFDDLGYGDMGANMASGLKIPADSKYLDPGKPTLTPNLDKLAAQSRRFTNGHSADGVCTPSRYALMTGRYAWRTSLKSGVKGGYSSSLLDADRFTVSKMFRSLGYRTAMVGKWHIGMSFFSPEGEPVDLANKNDALARNEIDFSKPLTDTPFHRGFDYFFGTSASLDMPPYAWLESRDDEVRMLVRGGIVGEDGKVDFSRATFATNADLKEGPETGNGRPGVYDPAFIGADYLQVQAQRTEDLIAEWAEDEQPFFIYVPFPAPHTPHAVQEQFIDSAGFRYGDYLVQTDFYTGQIIDALGDPQDPESIAANTVVFLSSDNGPETGAFRKSRDVGHDANGPFKGMKRDNWEGGTRVPFLVRWPGEVEPGVSDHLCWQGDFIATMAEALGYDLKEDEAPDTESFLSVLQGKSNPETGRGIALIQHSSKGQFALVDPTGEWKLIDGTAGAGNSLSADADNRDLPDSRGEIGGEPRQLYHLKTDPGEKENLLVDPTPEALAKEAELLAVLDVLRADQDPAP